MKYSFSFWTALHSGSNFTSFNRTISGSRSTQQQWGAEKILINAVHGAAKGFTKAQFRFGLCCWLGKVQGFYSNIRWKLWPFPPVLCNSASTVSVGSSAAERPRGRNGGGYSSQEQQCSRVNSWTLSVLPTFRSIMKHQEPKISLTQTKCLCCFDCNCTEEQYHKSRDREFLLNMWLKF